MTPYPIPMPSAATVFTEIVTSAVESGVVAVVIFTEVWSVTVCVDVA